jgi:hypothetical protein
LSTYVTILIFYLLSNFNLFLSTYLGRNIASQFPNKFTHIPTPDYKIAPVNALNAKLTPPQSCNIKPLGETYGLLTSLFTIKNRLDFTNIGGINYTPPSSFFNISLYTTLIGNTQGKKQHAKSISSLEHLIYSNYIEALNCNSMASKHDFSERLLKKTDFGIFTSFNLQNSLESAFDLASGTR